MDLRLEAIRLSAGQALGAQRVCPGCGEAAGSEQFCSGCGLNLTALDRLPSRAEWTRNHLSDGAESLIEDLGDFGTVKFHAEGRMSTANAELMSTIDSWVARQVEQLAGHDAVVEVSSTPLGRHRAAMIARLTFGGAVIEQRFICEMSRVWGVARVFPSGPASAATPEGVAVLPENRWSELAYAAAPDSSGLVSLGYWTAALIPPIGVIVGLAVATRPTAAVARKGVSIIVSAIIMSFVWFLVVNSMSV